MSRRCTVVGAGGFIGSALLHSLMAQGWQTQAWTRAVPLPPDVPLGHVFFAAGITADFRTRPHDTIETHVEMLNRILRDYSFESLTYLSSARLYRHAPHTREDAVFTVNPHDADCLYDISKIAGESLCLATGRADVRVARLSNVAGVDRDSANFLPSLIRDALAGRLCLRCAPASCKDYVMLSDVVSLLPRIAITGIKRIYNIAGGRVTEAARIAAVLSQQTGCMVDVEENAPLLLQPAIDITRARAEFGFSPAPLEPQLKDLIDAYRLVM